MHLRGSLSLRATALTGTLALAVAACSSSTNSVASSSATPAGASSPTSAATSPGTITIPAIEMLTGSGALYGEAVEQGLEVAATEINATGGILGKQVKLKVVDNASDNAQTTTLVKEFAADSRVGAIIPPTYQPNFNAACSAADTAGLPIISAQSGPPDASGDVHGYCFTMTTDPIPQVTFTLRALAARGITKLAMVYDTTNGYVTFQRPNIESAAKALGISIKEIGVDGASTDFSAQISQLISDNPQATFPFFTIEDASRFMQQARADGYTGKWFDPVSQLTSKRIPTLSAGAADGLLASTPQSAGNIHSFAAFLVAYQKQFGKPLDDPTYTGFGYDALMLLAQAMTRAGSTTDRAAIKAALDRDVHPCFSICYTEATSGSNNGAFLAGHFYMVQLTSSGFVPAK